jgi:hypothetical protein
MWIGVVFRKDERTTVLGALEAKSAGESSAQAGLANLEVAATVARVA